MGVEYVTTTTFSVKDYLKNNRKRFEEISTYVWNHPETRFEEYDSAEYMADALEKEGFIVERNVADIQTAFVATYGKGKPIIGFLGEFDALSGLSQEANVSKASPLVKGGIGHGCGHNLLGTGALAAAYAVKAFMQEHNVNGTVKFYGCPGEEGGSGKTFMVRDGVFNGLDVALTWHPSPVNSIMSLSFLANYQVYFRFKGISSHSANSPHLGRSALDAVELMNVGVNYLREHVIPEARMHYAVTNAGGSSPNVVQAETEVLYLIRAPKLDQVDEIFKRVCKVAEGAALMTGTQMTMEFDKACSNYRSNRTLEQILHTHLNKSGVEATTQVEEAFAKSIWESLNEGEQKNAVSLNRGFGYSGDGSDLRGKYLADTISEYVASNEVLPGSTDVSDVSWIVPTAQLTAATAAIGTPLHSWQMVSQGISSFAHTGMLRAAEAMAGAALDLFENPLKLKAVQDEHRKTFANDPYICPIPAHVKPSSIK